jgi:hypothetical protein
MQIEPELFALGATVIPAVVWLVRLEGRVNAADKADQSIQADLIAVKVRAESESAEHRRTAEALIRLEEQMKYVRELLERHFVEPEKPTRRRTPT